MFIHSSGELLLDQKRFEDAIEKFDRAIELEKQRCVLDTRLDALYLKLIQP